MKPSLPALALLAALLAGCAMARQSSSSEREWQRGQCAQIIDSEARAKCMKRVDE